MEPVFPLEAEPGMGGGGGGLRLKTPTPRESEQSVRQEAKGAFRNKQEMI